MRETGYYWVKIQKEWQIAEWKMSRFSGIPFWSLKDQEAYSPDDITEINETRIKNPDEIAEDLKKVATEITESLPDMGKRNETIKNGCLNNSKNG
jgi:hypothetical protein